MKIATGNSNMKTLKFRPKLVEKVLDCSKTITWRLFDEKDLQVGDSLELLNWETKEKFAEAKIINIEEKRLEDITETDLYQDGYISYEQMLNANKKYYGNKLNNNTIVKIIKFKLS